MPKVDIPSLDILRPAVDAVLVQFKKTHGRSPTKEEWEAVLTAALDRHELGVLIGVKIDVASDDELNDE